MPDFNSFSLKGSLKSLFLLPRNVAGTEIPGNITTILSLSWKAAAFLGVLALKKIYYRYKEGQTALLPMFSCSSWGDKRWIIQGKWWMVCYVHREVLRWWDAEGDEPQSLLSWPRAAFNCCSLRCLICLGYCSLRCFIFQRFPGWHQWYILWLHSCCRRRHSSSWAFMLV